MRFRRAISGACRFLGALESFLGHEEAVHALPLHVKMHVPVCTLLESFRPPRRRK